MHPCIDAPPKNVVSLPEVSEHCIKRNPGAAIETTEITNSDGAKIAWSEVKNACEIEDLTITEVCTRFRLKYPAVYARATRGNWKVISSINKRAKELQKREAELTTTAAQWAKRGEAHRFLVLDKASGAIQKAKMRPPKSWKEFDLADRAARRAAGLKNADVVQQTLIHLNEIGAEEPIEAELVTTLEGPQCSGVGLPWPEFPPRQDATSSPERKSPAVIGHGERETGDSKLGFVFRLRGRRLLVGDFLFRRTPAPVGLTDKMCKPCSSSRAFGALRRPLMMISNEPKETARSAISPNMSIK
jgi:hypothetical protein